MAHGIRIRADKAWTLGTQWTFAEATALDGSLAAAVNGDGGGTWSPTGNLLIGGAGLRLIGTNGAVQHAITGAHSAITTNRATQKFLTHGDSDYCQLGAVHTGATQVLRSPICGLVCPAGFLPIPPNFAYATVLGANCRIPLRVHNGSTFHAAQFSFAVIPGATAIPTQLPRFDVIQEDAFGKATSIMGGYQTILAPASTAAWVNGGALQQANYLVPGTGPLIDTSQYSYFAAIIDVSGPGAAVQAPGAVVYADPVVTFTNVLDIRPR